MVDNNLLAKYSSIGLDEMDSVKLMNRTDRKYIFSVKKLPDLLQSASAHYKILQIGQNRSFIYNSMYLDTADYQFYMQHVSERSHRVKIRYRTYMSSGTSFLEVKRKTPDNKTIKNRIEIDQALFPAEKINDFLAMHAQKLTSQIQPVLKNNFSRITLVGLDTCERITIDYDLTYFDLEKKHYSVPFLAIAELKTDGFSNNSPFLSLVKSMNIRRSGFSKYCMGNVLLRQMPKANSLKPKLLLLNKIEREN